MGWPKKQACCLPPKSHKVLEINSPVFSAIVLFENQPFPRVLFVVFQKEGSLGRMELEATPSWPKKALKLVVCLSKANPRILLVAF